ncbi:MAG TPA: squalene synthase HpnC, partial [Gemmatales bacterium]|nr:squalene synthase HpnC [Gemmatales bacterium]
HGPQATSRPCSFTEASAYCRWMAKSQYENFVVGSLLVPRELRPHFFHVYAFCRWADDLGDETATPEEALAALAWWRESLLAMFQGNATHPILIALQATVREFDIGPELFLDLLSAFEQDQTTLRYATFEQLLEYCRRSANPVGRLVLSLFRETAPGQLSASDDICTGLQLANFWQDVRRDCAKGRVYIPAEDLAQFECVTWIQHAGQPVPSGFRELIHFEVDRTAGYFQRGRSLILNLKPQHRAEIELIIRGGELVLDRIRQMGYDTWTTRPTVSKWNQAKLLLAILWRRCWPPRPSV